MTVIGLGKVDFLTDLLAGFWSIGFVTPGVPSEGLTGELDRDRMGILLGGWRLSFLFRGVSSLHVGGSRSERLEVLDRMLRAYLWIRARFS